MFTRNASLIYLIAASLVAVLTFSASAHSSDKTLTPLKFHPMAPEFILEDIYGRQHALADYRGKVVVVNFWATWCSPCLAEMPSMQRAANWLAKYDIPLLAVGVGETKDRVQRFHQNMPVTFPLLLDTGSEVMEAWAARSLPTTYVLDQKGQVIYLAIGSREWDSPKILKQILAIKK
jgi:peroxiredoxin